MYRKFLPVRALWLTVSCLLFSAAVMGQKGAAETYVKGEVLVKFKDGTTSVNARSANLELGSVVVENLADGNWQRVRLPAGVSVEKAIARYRQLDGVEYAQPNFYYHLLTTPDDPQFTDSGMYGLEAIKASRAWDLTTGSSAVVVAVIDTGMLYTHEDLAQNTWVNPGEIAGNGVDDDANGFVDDINGADFFFNDSNPLDEHGHGTHTAGTIGATGNNGIGSVGVNWAVKIMAIKIFDGSPGETTSVMLINAYNYVTMMKNRGINIRVTNNSYGGCSEACGYDQATKDALDAMGDAGILNVFAAGNSNADNDTVAAPNFPSTYTSPSILAVAASDQNDARAGFSNYGPISVDLAAPGLGVLSTTLLSNSSYGVMSGTSMAAPHVAGAAALLSAYNPSLSVASLKATLMNTVDPIPAWRSSVKTGGRLNVFNALQDQTTCSFPNGMSVPTKGGTFSVDLTPGTNCDYFVKSNTNWIKMTGADQFSGNATITFRVTVNPTIRRSGTIKIGGQTFTVTQSRN